MRSCVLRWKEKDVGANVSECAVFVCLSERASVAAVSTGILAVLKCYLKQDPLWESSVGSSQMVLFENPVDRAPHAVLFGRC
jgi:hypothetical protein